MLLCLEVVAFTIFFYIFLFFLFPGVEEMYVKTALDLPLLTESLLSICSVLRRSIVLPLVLSGGFLILVYLCRNRPKLLFTLHVVFLVMVAVAFLMSVVGFLGPLYSLQEAIQS